MFSLPKMKNKGSLFLVNWLVCTTSIHWILYGWKVMVWRDRRDNGCHHSSWHLMNSPFNALSTNSCVLVRMGRTWVGGELSLHSRRLLKFNLFSHIGDLFNKIFVTCAYIVFTDFLGLLASEKLVVFDVGFISVSLWQRGFCKQSCT